MSAAQADVLLGEATAFIAVAESGDAESSAYEQAAIKINAAMKANPALTSRDVGARIGKSKDYVLALLKALESTRSTGQPFKVNWRSGASGEHVTRAVGKAKPEVLVAALHQAIAAAPPEEREKIVSAVTDTKTVGGRHVENKVRENVKAETEKPKPAIAPTGIPLSAAWAGISMKLDQWARGMSNFDDDMIRELAETNPDGAMKISWTVERLEVETTRWLRGLRRVNPDLKVIENDGVIDVEARTA